MTNPNKKEVKLISFIKIQTQVQKDIFSDKNALEHLIINMGIKQNDFGHFVIIWRDLLLHF